MLPDYDCRITGLILVETVVFETVNVSMEKAVTSRDAFVDFVTVLGEAPPFAVVTPEHRQLPPAATSKLSSTKQPHLH